MIITNQRCGFSHSFLRKFTFTSSGALQLSCQSLFAALHLRWLRRGGGESSPSSSSLMKCKFKIRAITPIASRSSALHSNEGEYFRMQRIHWAWPRHRFDSNHRSTLKTCLQLLHLAHPPSPPSMADENESQVPANDRAVNNKECANFCP